MVNERVETGCPCVSLTARARQVVCYCVLQSTMRLRLWDPGWLALRTMYQVLRPAHVQDGGHLWQFGAPLTLLPQEEMRETTPDDFRYEDLERLPTEELARITEWLTEKVDALSTRLKAEPKEDEVRKRDSTLDVVTSEWLFRHLGSHHDLLGPGCWYGLYFGHVDLWLTIIWKCQVCNGCFGSWPSGHVPFHAAQTTCLLLLSSCPCSQDDDDAEAMGDVDLFALAKEGEALTVNSKWLQHLEERLLGEDGHPRKAREGEDPHRWGHFGTTPAAQRWWSFDRLHTTCL